MLIDTEYNHGSTNVNNYSSLTSYYRGYKVARMKYGERLLKARTYAKLTQKQLADKINNVCTQENISKLERSDATGSEFTAQFADACGVRAIWLAEGKGEMTDGYYVEDERLIAALRLMQPLPPYAIDHVIKEIAETAELINQAERGGGAAASDSA